MANTSNDGTGRPLARTNELASLGPFFAVDVHRQDEPPVRPWRSLRELIDAPERLAERIDKVRRSLALRAAQRPEHGGQRVAASITQLGLVARIVSPAIGAAVLGVPLDTRPSNWWWQDELGGPFPASAAPAATVATNSTDLLATFVGPLIDAVQELVPISTRVLWGNVASAVNTAGVLIAQVRPDLATRALAETSAWRHDQRLRREDGGQGTMFRRASCCLMYRLAPPPAAAMCEDCILLAR